jgi:hypothetical protein
MLKIIKRSNAPLFYSIKISDLEYLCNIRNLLNEYQLTNDNFFKFPGSIEPNKLRKNLPINKFFESSGNISNFHKFITAIVNLFIKSYFSEYKINYLHEGQFIARIRLFEDYPGYFLAPHNDSVDTIASLILPIIEGQEKTTSFELMKSRTINNSEGDLEKLFAQLFESIGVHEYTYQNNEFGIEKNVRIASSNDNKILLVSSSVDEKKLKYNIFINREYTLESDEILCIPNPNCQYIDVGNKFYKEYISKISRHGVMPTKHIRRNLIVDLVVANGPEASEDRFGYKNEFDYLIEYGKKTKEKLFH